ncbi:GNAT family N-acetyltransferase [Streptomyces sp. NPDC058001]|uniref:GNAT family N-acetyltransferase n=1 Tax=Streptomyces sp. NPDC058001 TaxID=3346300 RepID=UPI0036E616D1
MHTWTIQSESVAAAGVEDALWEYAAEVARRVWGRSATESELREAMKNDPHDDLAPPHGMFLAARADDGALLGYVGVRLLAEAPATAEIKRMYVRPTGRGTGLGRGLLLAAEAAARGLGAARIVLETNTRLTEARAMYEAHGYAETAPYNDHDAAEHWYGKPL